MAKKEGDKGEITINDIAKELGIATSTVSRALNNSNKISDATKKKVHAVAQELGYEINLVASSLSKNKTNLIGVIVPSIYSQFFSKALSAIQKEAKASGYNVIISQTNESFEEEVDVLKVMNSARVDGLIVCLSAETKTVDHFNALIKKKVPVAMFDRVHYDIPGPKVVVDNYEAAYKATEHLSKIGCKRIAHLAGPFGCKVFDERADGYRDALKANGLALYPQFLLSCDLREKDTRDALQMWMAQEERPDGIVVANASAGLILASNVKSYGISIPEDLSVISLGNERCNELMVPSLSAIDMPGEEMGKTATVKLLKRIKDKKTDNSIVVKPFRLLIRNSTFRKS